MNEMLREILKNHKVKSDDMFQDHDEGGYTVKNVPCREVEGIGIVYKAKTMQKVLNLLDFMRDNDLNEVDFKFEVELTVGDKIKIKEETGKFSAYKTGDVMTVSEVLKTRVVGIDKHSEEHMLWKSNVEKI